MFSTTLRLQDELGSFLQSVAKAHSLSVNAFLTQLLEREQQERHRQRLAQDWATYGQEEQEMEYALDAQSEVLAERPEPYVVKTGNPDARPRQRKKAKATKA